MGLMFKTLARQRLRYKGFMSVFLVLALIVSAASVLMTRLSGDLGQAAIDADMTALLQLFGIVTGIMVIRATASAVSALILGRFAGRAGYRFRENFAKFFLHKPFSTFDGASSGQSLSVFSNDLPAAVELVSNGGIRMLADIITLLVSIAYLIYLNWWLTLIFIAAFPVLIIMQSLIAVPIQKKTEAQLGARADVNAIATDCFQNMGVITAYSLEKVMTERYTSTFETWISSLKSWARSFCTLILAGILASMTPLLIIIAVSAGQVISGNLSFAEWIAFVGLASEAGSWLMMLSQRQNQVQSSAAGAKRLGEHMSDETEDITAGSNMTVSGDIAVSAVGLKFSYGALSDFDSAGGEFSGRLPSSPTDAGADGEGAVRKGADGEGVDGVDTVSAGRLPSSPTDADAASEDAVDAGAVGEGVAEFGFALDGVSFEIKRGSRVAFVGGSGSGKSTVLKILLGLYAPQEGTLSVMGANTTDVSLESLRDVFAYVPQDSFLFPEPISGNITGQSAVSDKAKLEKACRDAGILEFIESLPEGFDATLSESGENVSGGQKQRIALARAFYRDAPIILFDEATSALDPATETAVLQSFNTLSKDKTVIMVAHRRGAIDFCDSIIVLDAGKIASIGTHDELITSCAIYKKLYESQQGEVAA